MATFESLLHYANPGEERLRLWYMQKRPEVERKFQEMKRDNDAELGQRVRASLREAPYNHQAIVNLCKAADEKEAELARFLNEGVEVEAARLRTAFLHAALNHPGESDPTEELRDRIRSEPSETRYCSPVLVETLLWEGMEGLPNTHRKRVELDFPARVESLLDFHCIAFHADVDVLKELYDEDVLQNREKRQEVLGRHRAQMEVLMVTFAQEMKKGWDEEKERLRLQAAQGSPTESPGWSGANDWSIGQSRPPNTGVGGGERRAHMTDPPTILGAAKQKTTPSPPLRGILKKGLASPPIVPNSQPASSQKTVRVPVESLTFDEATDAPDSFFLEEMIGEDTRGNPNQARYLGPEIVVDPPRHRQYTSASSSRSYEIFRPHLTREDMARTTPRAMRGVADPTHKFEQMDKGKGKPKLRD